MDNSSAASNTHPPAHNAPQQQSALIRTEQVQKLPHLSDVQKASHTQAVRTLWDALTTHPQGSPEYMTAHAKLSQISMSLMKGMKLFQQSRAQQQHLQQQAQVLQQQQQQAQQRAAGGQQQQPRPGGPQQAGANQQPGQRPSVSMPTTFQQLAPQIQAKVNLQSFVLPPGLNQPQSEKWIADARYRFGLALQKQEIGKVKLHELRQQYTQRQNAGGLTQEQIQDVRTRQVGAEKLIREATEYFKQFSEQQELFRGQQGQTQQQQQQQQQQGQQQQQQFPGVQGQAQNPISADGSRPQSAATNAATGAPAPHTISSAVSAARNQAGQPLIQTQQQQVQGAAQQPQQQAQPTPQQAPGQQQRAFPQQTPDGSAQMPAAPQSAPRPLSGHAAMNQAAQNYSGAVTQQSMAAQAAQAAQAANSHAHPHALSRGESGTRNVNMQIPKNLNVPPPEPVAMGPARPTLTAAGSHGSMGPIGQPAIQRLPGYVLEGEGQRVLSKKMLDTLVRQVTGGGDTEGLTPDAEEFILQMADDFVDEVCTAACRLAKLRPSSALDIRDIQLVLERNYNIRIPGFSSDDLRTVKKPHPTAGWTQKMSAVQAAKVTQARID